MHFIRLLLISKLIQVCIHTAHWYENFIHAFAFIYIDLRLNLDVLCRISVACCIFQEFSIETTITSKLFFYYGYADVKINLIVYAEDPSLKNKGKDLKKNIKNNK